MSNAPAISAIPKIALCLSGGGFRATLFHLGSLRRLNELGVLGRLSTVCSVSGGSVTNGVLAVGWNELKASEDRGVLTRFEELIAKPIRAYCQRDLRTEVLLWDRVNPINWPALIRTDISVTDRLAQNYTDGLKLGVPLRLLPMTPEFVFCATNLERGACWRFKAQEMGDYDTGWGPTDEVTVAYAVAASSAYPVTFPPLRLKLDRSKFRFGHYPNDPHPEIVTLTDGGVYDNLGLEPVRANHDFVLVSDAGRPLAFLAMPDLAPYGRVSRSLDVIGNQVGAQRKRWLIDSFKAPNTKLFGAYWGIASKASNYEVANAPAYDQQVLDLLTEVRTDLDSFSVGEIACLENHGYALANVAIQRWTRSLCLDPDAQFNWPDRPFADTENAVAALRESSKRGILNDIWNSVTEKAQEWL